MLKNIFINLNHDNTIGDISKLIYWLFETNRDFSDFISEYKFDYNEAYNITVRDVLHPDFSYELKEDNILLETTLSIIQNIIHDKDVGERDTSVFPHQAYINVLKIIYKVISNFRENEVLTIVVESNYVDISYRDSYYMYFSSKHFNYSRFCKRVFLFKSKEENNILDSMRYVMSLGLIQKSFLGSFVIRPLPSGVIGKVFIDPKYFLSNNSYIRTTKFKQSMLGVGIHVKAFPHSMQNGETTTCAEVTIMNLLDYFSREYNMYREMLPSEISKITSVQLFARNIPSQGLHYSVVSKVLSEAGFYPVLHFKEDFKEEYSDREMLKQILYHYVESAIPVALEYRAKEESKNCHSILCVGHMQQENIDFNNMVNAEDDFLFVDTYKLVHHYIVMDDNHTPYYKFDINKYELKCLVIPLYKRMFLEALKAKEIFKKVLAHNKYGIKAFIERSDKEGIDNVKKVTGEHFGTNNNFAVIRIFLASSRSLKEERIKSFGNENNELRVFYSQVLCLPKFVWVCEIFNSQSYMKDEKKAIGEIILDATSSKEDMLNSIVLFHYPFCVSFRNIDEDFNDFLHRYETREHAITYEDWSPFDAYCGNLEQIGKGT